MAITPRRDHPETWYPAGVAEVAARLLTLSSGERVRVLQAKEHDAAAPDVLLLHGWGCNVFHFRYVVPALARRGVRAFAVDLRGHGLSDKPRDEAAYTSPRLVTFVQQLLDAVNAERVGVLGHSLGAAIAVDAALALPQRVRWLTLLNPVGITPLRGAGILKLLPVHMAERLPAGLCRFAGWLALRSAYGQLAKPAAGDLDQYSYPTLMPGGRFGALAYARAFQWDARGEAVLQRIRCPLHVLVGERDRVLGAMATKQALARVQQARVQVVAGAGHVLAEEVPELVADVVAQAAAEANTLPNDEALDLSGRR